jgi:hypothetical protein
MSLISETGTESCEGVQLRRETGVRLCEASFNTELTEERPLRVDSENGGNGEESKE